MFVDKLDTKLLKQTAVNAFGDKGKQSFDVPFSSGKKDGLEIKCAVPWYFHGFMDLDGRLEDYGFGL